MNTLKARAPRFLKEKSPLMHNTKQQKELHANTLKYWIDQAYRRWYKDREYIAVDDAPNNWNALQEWFLEDVIFKKKGALPVYKGGSEKTIYGKAETNHKFRAWHDMIHLENNLSFSYDDEMKVAKIHAQQLRDIGAPTWVINAVYCDVAGQVIYYYHHKQYVDNQKQFVLDCINNGLIETARNSGIY